MGITGLAARVRKARECSNVAYEKRREHKKESTSLKRSAYKGEKEVRKAERNRDGIRQNKDRIGL